MANSWTQKSDLGYNIHHKHRVSMYLGRFSFSNPNDKYSINCKIPTEQIKIENISTTMQEGRSLFMWFFFFPNQICRLNKEGIWIDKNVQRIYCCLNYSEQTLHSSNIPPILLKIIIGKVLNKIPLSYHCNPNENPS